MNKQPASSSFIVLAYLYRISPLYVAVFLMRFSFAFTVVALQWLVPSRLDRGIISAAYPIAEMASAFFLGVLADRIGRKWIIVGGLLASSFITFSFTLTRSVPLLVAIHGLQGICAAAIVTSTLALLTDVAKKESRGREMGMYDFCTISGYAFGFVFGFLIIGQSASRVEYPFYSGAVVALVGCIIAATLLKDAKIPSPIKVSIKKNVRKILSSKSAMSIVPTWFVLMMVIGVFLTYTREILFLLTSSGRPILGFPGLGERFSLRIGVVEGILIVFAAILLGFSQTSFGSLSDRVGRGKLVLLGQVSIIGLMGTLILLFSFGFNNLLAIPFVVFFGIGLLAFTPAALAELADIAPETGRGSTMGFYSVTVGAGTIFGPLAGAELITRYGLASGFSMLFAIGIFIVLLALIPRLINSG